MDFLASASQYRDHLAPIAEEIGGTFVSRIEANADEGLLVVASARDLRTTKRPAIFVEHGSGQTYRGIRLAAYPGGDHRERVRLFICPSNRVAAANRARYVDAKTIVVGCPKLDRFAGWTPTGTEVAIGFHWPCRVVPETYSAFSFYSEALSGLVSHFGSVVGTFHPRWGDALLKPYRESGIKVVRPFEEVVKRASVFITDNSSAGWEAMALGIPVVWLNAPWYRKDVEHGLRFWEFANAGVQVDEPAGLVAGVELALEDPAPVRRRRREAVRAIYGEMDGKASYRAARAIEEME
jgi:hypothetical protein